MKIRNTNNYAVEIVITVSGRQDSLILNPKHVSELDAEQLLVYPLPSGVIVDAMPSPVAGTAEPQVDSEGETFEVEAADAAILETAVRDIKPLSQPVSEENVVSGVKYNAG